jgi:long-subunit acyl-CoA synthetase (AMP-forming)
MMMMNILQRSVAERALDAATLCEAFQITAATCPQRVALRTSGDRFVLTWQQYAERVRRTAAGLAALGVRRGDTVALMLSNRPEFHWVDVAAMHLGATTFGVYNTFAQEQVDYVLNDSGATVAITEQALAPTLRQARGNCPRLIHLMSVDGGEGMLSLDEVDAAGDPGFELSSTWPAVDRDDVVALVYTSGTTGPPKGVQLTHGGVIANGRALHEAIPAYRDGFSAVSYLPLAHASVRRGYGKDFRLASRPRSPSNRTTSTGKPSRKPSRPGYGWCAPSKPTDNPPRSCWPRIRNPARWWPACGRAWV